MKKALLLLLLPVLSPATARACSCVEARASTKQKVAAAYQQAALVVVGQVVRVDTVTTTDTIRVADAGAGGPLVQVVQQRQLRYTFAVARQLKGPATGPTVLITTNLSGAACGKHFATGTEQLVYAYSVSRPGPGSGSSPLLASHYATGLCTRSQELRAVPRTELRQLTRLERAGRRAGAGRS